MNMNSFTGTTEIGGTVCFFLAIVHTFSVNLFQRLAKKYPSGSIGENSFHLLGEVEVVFGIWAFVFLLWMSITQDFSASIRYLEGRNFTEPAFVFVVMAICATRPILNFAAKMIENISRILPLKRPLAFFSTCLVIGPIMGSFITEPAAMTVTALILLERFYKQNISVKLMYATIGLLFVNISIGGTLTPYAAPPVLMVAKTWGWDLNFMSSQFGWKAVISMILSTALVTFRFRHELKKVSWKNLDSKQSHPMPIWLTVSHIIFLTLVVFSAHHITAFVGIFLFFLGFMSVTREYQHNVNLREGLLVAFFLGGLVVLGGPQRWWLEPLISQLSVFTLYIGSIALTAITDNAALTFLGTQVPSLSEASKYALVAGAVTGGGLTVIANAPNPAGYGILGSSFGENGISPMRLFLSALIPTLIAAICFWIL